MLAASHVGRASSQPARSRYSSSSASGGSGSADGSGVPLGSTASKSPQPSCQIFPVSASIRSSRWVVSGCAGCRSLRVSSVTVVTVCSPGSMPLMASMVTSAIPSGRVKSWTGSSLSAATSAM
jgi:hypothetical protein